MNTQTLSAPKLKAGTPMTLNGKTVYIEHDKQNGQVVVCDSPTRGINDKYDVVDYDDLSPVLKLRKPIQSKRNTPEQKAQKSELDLFYDQMTLCMPDKCENCGASLVLSNKTARRANTAHLLPKSKFESIATNPLNIVYLGADFIGGCGCHDRFDANSDIRKSMPIYITALQRFQILKHEIPADLLKAAYTYLNITWE